MSGVKESRVLLASVSDAVAVREILTQVLPVKAEVRKTREIYRVQGVQVHLDTVVGLGSSWNSRRSSRTNRSARKARNSWRPFGGTSRLLRRTSWPRRTAA